MDFPTIRLSVCGVRARARFEGPEVAEAASALPRSLHAHQCRLAKHGRAILPRPHGETSAAGVFRDVMELVEAIETYVDQHNENLKPFIWTASANDILEKIKRARKAVVNVQSV
jgi:hypothetical protein